MLSQSIEMSILTRSGPLSLEDMARQYESKCFEMFKKITAAEAVRKSFFDMSEDIKKDKIEVDALKVKFDTECGKRKTNYDAMKKSIADAVSRETFPMPEPLAEIPIAMTATRAPPKKVAIFGPESEDDKGATIFRGGEEILQARGGPRELLALPNISIIGEHFFSAIGGNEACKGDTMTFNEARGKWITLAKKYQNIIWSNAIKEIIFAAGHDEKLIRKSFPQIPYDKITYLSQKIDGEFVGTPAPYDLGHAIKVLKMRQTRRAEAAARPIPFRT